MSDIRASRTKKNISTAFLCQIVTLICGIIVPRLMIGNFGSEVYGATTSISQFLSYIMLLEGGLGGVGRAVLYKPLAENDMITVSGIMKEMKRLFRIIAGIFFVYALVLACSFKSIADLEQLDRLTTFWLVLAIGFSTWAQYYIGITYTVLLQAAQRSYITNRINITATIINALLIVLMISLDCSIVIVKLVSSIVFTFKPVALWLYVRKKFCLPDVQPSKETYLKQKWSGLGQHIAYFLHTNTDIVVLTLFSNLKAVAVYSVYNMVVSSMQNLCASFVSGMEAMFGDMLAKGEHDQLRKAFGKYETVISAVSVMLFSVTAVLILPFVGIYTAGITDANYEAPLFSVMIVFAALLYCISRPYHSLVIAAGHFKETQLAAYGEAAINIVLSVLLVRRFGLTGVAAGTVIATGFRMIYYVFYLEDNIFYRHAGYFFKRFAVNMAAFGSVYAIGRYLISLMEIDNYGMWILAGIMVTAVSAAVNAALNGIFYREDFAALTGNRFRGKAKH